MTELWPLEISKYHESAKKKKIRLAFVSIWPEYLNGNSQNYQRAEPATIRMLSPGANSHPYLASTWRRNDVVLIEMMSCWRQSDVISTLRHVTFRRHVPARYI